MGRVVLRDHESATRFLVQTMDDSRTFLSSDAGKILAMRQKRVDQRMLLMPGAGMHDNSCRLVQDEEIVVLENNVERDLLRLRFDLLDFRFAHFHLVAGSDEIPRPGRFPVVADELFSNQGLKSGPGKGRKRVSKEAVKPLSRLVVGNEKLRDSWRRRHASFYKRETRR